MKTLLLGMCNPSSRPDSFPLWPEPKGCTGYRIWQMMHDTAGVSVEDYLRVFDRRNLVEGAVWSGWRARAAARKLFEEELPPHVVVLGKLPWGCLMNDEETIPPLHHREVNRTYFWHVPHPSGLNRWYNEQKNRANVGLLLCKLGGL